MNKKEEEMNLLLNTRERNKKHIRKGVKKMKKIYVLTAVMFFLLGVGMSAFALDMTSGVNTTQTNSGHVEYVYNPYGISISATETTTTTMRTVDAYGGWSETVTVQSAYSSWRGGSLKINSAGGSSDTKGSDGSNSHTDFWSTYGYNANGRLASASGGSATKGSRGVDANGQAIGTFESSTTDNYIIHNGQALRSSSTTTGTNYGPDGKATSYSSETTNYTYALLGGSWQLKGEVSTSTSSGPSGSQTITRRRTYNRDANGGLQGITQTATGSGTDINQTTGGSTSWTMQNYQATFAYDPAVGWYLASEKWDK